MDSTEADLSFLQQEENRQELMLVMKPLINAAVHDSMSNLASHEEVAQVGEQIGNTIADRMATKFGEWFDKLADAQQERFDSFVTLWDERIVTLATKEELAGVVAAGAENTVKIAALETAHEVKFNNLRTTHEDSRRHFESMTGAHGEAIAELKSRLDKHEKRTEENIQSIKASTANIDTRTLVMQSSILEFIEANKTHREATASRIDILDVARQEQQRDMERMEQRVVTEGTIVRDIDERVRGSQARIEAALFGSEKEKTPGLVATMTALQRGLYFQTLLFGTRVGRGVLAGMVALLVIIAAMLSAVILGRPDLIFQYFPHSN